MELLETESMAGNRCENLESNNVRATRNRLRRVALLVNRHSAAVPGTAFTRATSVQERRVKRQIPALSFNSYQGESTHENKE